MRAGVGVNLWLTRQRHCPGLCVGAFTPISEAIRHKGSAEAYFLLDFLLLFYQEKRKEY